MPEPITSHSNERVYTPDDYPLVQNLLRRARSPERIAEYPSPVDLEEVLGLSGVQTRLWFGLEDRLTAFAFVDEFGNLHFEIEPQSAPELAGPVLDWACAIARLSGEPPGTSCRSTNTAHIALLERRGFIRTPDVTFHFLRPLDTPIPEPSLPAGFSIRPSAEAASIQEWVAMHRRAWGSHYMTVKRRRAMMSTSDYDPALDLAVTAPDGRLAGYCVAFIAHSENAITGRRDAYTDPVAVHPKFQRRGLATALLRFALRLLQDRGLQAARLSTASDNLPMQRAAASAGFIRESETWFYQLPS